MTTVKPATAEQRAEWIHTASHIDDAEFSEAIFAYEAALVALESELAALKAEYVPDPARNKGESMERGRIIDAELAVATKAEATIETLTKDLMEARQEADNVSAHHMGTTHTLNLLRGDIATALGGVYGTPGFDCIADLTAKVTQLVTGLTAEKKRSNEMHRRAQASEGADERLARVRKGYAEELRRFIDRGYAWRATWKNRYREAAAQLVSAGVPDDWVSPCGLKGRTGILSELISRLVSQRDDARAAAQVQADEIARIKAEHASKSHAEWHALNDRWSELYATKEMEHAAEIARMTAELQRAHEAGERLQATGICTSCDIRTGKLCEWHQMQVERNDYETATNGLLFERDRLRADLAAAVKRAEVAAAKLWQAVAALDVCRVQAANTAETGSDADVALDAILAAVHPILADANRATGEWYRERQQVETLSAANEVLDAMLADLQSKHDAEIDKVRAELARAHGEGERVNQVLAGDLAVTRAALAQCARVMREARRCLDGSYGSEEAASDTIEDIDAALAHGDVDRAVRVEAARDALVFVADMFERGIGDAEPAWSGPAQAVFEAVRQLRTLTSERRRDGGGA